MNKIAYVANTDWYLYNFRLSLMKTMADRGWEVWAVAPKSSYGEKLKEFGIRFHPLEMNRKGKNPFRDFGLFLRLFRLYRKERPDIVHHFTIKPVIYGSFAAKLVPNIFVVNAVTGLGYVFGKKGIMQRLVKGLYRLALRGNNYTVFQNEENLAYFVQEGLVPRKKAFLIKGSGVDIQKFSPGNNKNVSTQKVVFLMASRMLWDKGVREFVAAAEAVKARFPEAVFWLAGSVDIGNPSAVSENWLKEKVESGVVIWWGHQDDIKSFIQKADVIVLPTFYPEGLPKVLLEGAAMEKPIITTDVPGCREIVEEGINGLLVPIRNVEKLAEAMAYMIENQDMRAEMGKRGREKVVRDFSDERVIHETLEVYRMAKPKLFL